LLEIRLDAPTTVDHVRMTRIELSPGQAAGRHRHPCPVFGCVLAGRIRFQLTGGPETILEPGQAFHEPAGVEIPHFDNASDDDAAVFVACYLLSPGEDRVIELLDPDPSE
jgi:quercetin dioxygenase-like cupin family protein